MSHILAGFLNLPCLENSKLDFGICGRVTTRRKMASLSVAQGCSSRPGMIRSAVVRPSLSRPVVGFTFALSRRAYLGAPILLDLPRQGGLRSRMWRLRPGVAMTEPRVAEAEQTSENPNQPSPVPSGVWNYLQAPCRLDFLGQRRFGGCTAAMQSKTRDPLAALLAHPLLPTTGQDPWEDEKWSKVSRRRMLLQQHSWSR